MDGVWEMWRVRLFEVWIWGKVVARCGVLVTVRVGQGRGDVAIPSQTVWVYRIFFLLVM
jgi:hypothetical protein